MTPTKGTHDHAHDLTAAALGATCVALALPASGFAHAGIKSLLAQAGRHGVARPSPPSASPSGPHRRRAPHRHDAPATKVSRGSGRVVSQDPRPRAPARRPQGGPLHRHRPLARAPTATSRPRPGASGSADPPTHPRSTRPCKSAPWPRRRRRRGRPRPPRRRRRPTSPSTRARPTPGAFSVLTVRVPNERDDKGTVKVDLRLPHGIYFLSYKKVPGWKVKLTKTKLDHARHARGPRGRPARSPASSGPATRRRAASSGPDQFEEFPLSVRVPDGNAGDELVFRAVQTYRAARRSAGPARPGRRHARAARDPPGGRPRLSAPDAAVPSRRVARRAGAPEQAAVAAPLGPRPAPTGRRAPARAPGRSRSRRLTPSSTRSASGAGRREGHARSSRPSAPMVISARGRSAHSTSARAIASGE